MGGIHKATMAADGASEGWIHHNQINWKCGGLGELDMTQRTIIEDCMIACTSPNKATPRGHQR